MTLTRPDAERLVRLLTLEQDDFEWNKRTCGEYWRNEFRLRFFHGEIGIDCIPAEAGDLAQQAATLDQEAFGQWYDDHLEKSYLTQDEAVEWLLAQAPRFDAADVEKSLQDFASVSFDMPFTHQYDWDGVLRLAAVLQSGAKLEYRFSLWLPPRHRQADIRMEWRAPEQDYRIVAREIPERLPADAAGVQDGAIAGSGTTARPDPPCLEIIGDVDAFGAFFETHYRRDVACLWIDFIDGNRSADTDRTTEKLRAEYAIPLTPVDCQPFLRALRAGRVWLQSGDPSTEVWETLRYEEGNYVRRWSKHIVETGIGGNTTYEGPAGGSEVLTEGQAIEAVQSRIIYRHRLQKILQAWAPRRARGRKATRRSS